MSVSAILLSKLTATEVLEANVSLADAANRDVKYSGLDLSLTLNAGSTPAVSKVACGEIAMTAGAATLNLRTVLGTNGVAVDGNGLKVQALIFKSKAGNANPIKIGVGASSGYNIFGAADGSFTLAAAGDRVQVLNNDSLADIDDTHKEIDITGTGTQVLQYLILMG